MKTQYDIVFDYKDNKHFNQDLNALVRKSASDNFEKWIFKHKHFNNFLPVTIINEKNEIIAALGSAKFDIFINNEKCTAIQLGNIFLKDAHRHEGLEKLIINAAIEKYSNVVDVIVACSNVDDEDIYKETEFQKVNEYLYFMPWNNDSESIRNKIKKLDLEIHQDLEIVVGKIKHSTKQSFKLDTKQDSAVKTFNIIKYFSDDIYHIPSLDVVVCFKHNDIIFDLIAVFSHDKIDLNLLLNIIVPKGIKRIDFGFIPDFNQKLYISQTDVFLRSAEQRFKSNLWIKEITTRIADSKIIFPILARHK